MMTPSRPSMLMLLFPVLSLLATAAPLQERDQRRGPEPVPLQQLNKRERAFQAMLDGSIMEGAFTQDDLPRDAPPASDRYTLDKVEKLDDGRWRFHTRVQYGKSDFTVGVPVRVLWTEETPMITVDDFRIPLVGTFSARVLFHEDQYAGVWDGGDHGGQMWGRVLRDAARSADAPDPVVPNSAEEGHEPTVNWPSFRGPGASGVSYGFETPSEWDVDSGQGLLWRVPLPGLAHSSPIVWGDRVFVTTAVKLSGDEPELRVGLYGSIDSVPDEGPQSFRLLCLDKNNGELLWERECWNGIPRFERHPKSSFAVPTPATDGEHVVAFFGTEGIYGFNVDSDRLWMRDFGPLDAGFFLVKDAQWGFGSSPVIHDGKVLVQCDVQENSFVAALSAKNGKDIWRVEREDVPTWCSPTIDIRPGRSQVLCNGWKQLNGYDLETGAELWRLEGLEGGGDIPVPTPVVEGDLVFMTSAHGRNAPIYAIDAKAKGLLKAGGRGDSLAWHKKSRGNYMQTPLVHDGLLYCCSDGGVLTVYSSKTGEQLYRERLGGGSSGFSASAVAADGKLYLTSEVGDVYVCRLGERFELLATNDLGEECMATPAISEGTILWRTRTELIAVGLQEQ